MSKKRFIQQVIIRSLPETGKLAEAIRYAESLWDGLNKHGYGDSKAHAPRENTDWYTALSDRQRKWFTCFWNNFNYKFGRNEAAMRWAQLGDPADEQYQFICDAAKKESLKQLPDGISRKRADGWLHARRYDDYQPVKTDPRQAQNHILMRINNELTGLKKLYEASGDEALLSQIKLLEEKLRDARAQS